MHSLSVYSGTLNLIWNLDLVPMTSAYVLLGILYRQHAEKLARYENHFLTMTLFVLSILFSTLNFKYWSHVDIWGNCYGFLPFFYSGAVCATYAVVLVLKNIVTPRIWVFLGLNSLLLYGLHRMVIEVCFMVWNKWGIPYDGVSILSLGVAVCNVFMVGLCIYPLASFVNKRCPWILGKF